MSHDVYPIVTMYKEMEGLKMICASYGLGHNFLHISESSLLKCNAREL